MNTPKGRTVFDRYIPIPKELQQMADLMVRFKLSASADIDGLIEDRFARHANTEGISDDVTSILRH
jgi:NitT/TauT family transport system substrate-binding protein